MFRVFLALIALLATSCGTRVSHQAVMQASGRGLPPRAGDPQQTASFDSGAVTPNNDASVATNGTGAVIGDSRSQTVDRGEGGGDSRPSSNVQTPSGGFRSPAPKSRGEPIPATGTPDTKSAIVLASVSTLSGPIGAQIKPWVQGIQAWVRLANSRGGVNGHAVRLLTFDDGADPAKHRAQVQEAVERHGAIAFINAEPFGAASVDYIDAKRVPVIVSSGAETWALRSPMYFPAAAEGDSVPELIIAGAAGRWVPKGKTKLGWVICVEASVCDDAARVFSDQAPKLGFEAVYKGRASIAQPDYTAECLAARSAEAEVFLVALESSGFQRLAAACIRQGYRPAFATNQAAFFEEMKNNVNIEGMTTAVPAFPFFQTGTPATDEFRRAVAQYVPDITLGALATLGWSAAKLFETAAAHLAEPPTREGLLRGLWSISGDTLGGLTQPLTFVENKPPVTRACWFDVTLANRSWVSPDGFQLHCR
jgi:branched-chain amino acid transport system substrate-binding protein